MSRTKQEDATARGDPPVLPHKHSPPGLPANVILRPRLDELFRKKLKNHTVVQVVAASCTGKTVQTQLAVEHSNLRSAWLTLDGFDDSPSRLLNALATSVAAYCPGGTRALHMALRSGARVHESAAVLATSMNDAHFVLVIDDAEHLTSHEDLRSGLATFLDYAPPSMRCLVLSRAPLGEPFRTRTLDQAYALISESDLRLTLDETREFLRTRGRETEDVGSVHAATGGWIAGLAFGFASCTESAQTEFSAYLRQHILLPLTESEREFLIKSSLADSVTLDLVEAMLGAEARAAFYAVRDRHLPAVTSESDRLVYHSVLRSFLLSEFNVRYPAEECRLRVLGARHFEVSANFEQATDWYIRAGDFDSAAQAAERAAATLCQKADWATILRWLDIFDLGIHEISPTLLAAWIRALFGALRDEAQTVIRQADELGLLEPATKADPSLLATVGSALYSDPAEALHYLTKYQGDFRVRAVRYMIEATTGTEPAAPPIASGWDNVERTVSWGLLWQGRLGEVTCMPPMSEDTPLVHSNLILAHLWRGDLENARSMWARVPQAARIRPHSRFIEGCILHAEENFTEALSCLQSAVADSRPVRFSFDDVYEVFAADSMLALGETADTILLLHRKIGELTEASHMATLELAQTILGLALLHDDRPEEACHVLETCAASMNRARRLLFLPRTATYLSEAFARLGDFDAAHKSAVNAYDAATRMESNFWLLEALKHVPSVVERESARDPGDSRWRRVRFLAPSAQRAAYVPSISTPASFIDVLTMGSNNDLVVNGTRTGVGRIKVIELVALLALSPRGIDRFAMQRLLFPDVDQRRGGNHFRQILHKLRVLTGLSLVRSGQMVHWPSHTLIEASDLWFERSVTAASCLTGRDRFDRLGACLAEVTGGYLEDSDLPWVEERRYHLDVVREEATLEFSELALEFGCLDEARAASEQVLQRNPYSDQAYSVRLRVERIVGSHTSCLAVYRRAVDALGEIGIEPSAAAASVGADFLGCSIGLVSSGRGR